MKRLTLTAALVLFLSGLSFSQDRGIAAFSIWKPKEGQELRFEAGYKQHLQWHLRSGDKWDWYGWYVLSGKNVGLFVDATFGHSWNDFMYPVDPAGDRADNDLHTEPFGIYLRGFKISRIEDASVTDSTGLRTKFSRMVTMKVSDLPVAEKILIRLKEKYAVTAAVRNFQCFKVIDGGDLYQMILLIGLNDLTQFANSEDILAHLSEIEHTLKIRVITEMESELLVFKSDMSLIRQ